MLETAASKFMWNTAADIAAAVASGRASAASVVEATIARIREFDPLLNSFTEVTEQRAVARARSLDEARAAGKPLGPLAGVPFAVKNLFDIAGLRTLAGSKINRDLPPAARDATLIQRLEAAGAILMGALNMGEYAYDFTGENIHYGASHNPYDLERMTGGSSGGSGAAVAGGLVPLSLGSDTNGSIRVPASLCGLFGLKATYGRLSRAGTYPFVASLDHVGPLSHSPMTPCRVKILRTPYARSGKSNPSSPFWNGAQRACASPWPAATSNAEPRRPYRPWTELRRPSAPTATSNYRRPGVRAQRPS